MFRHLNLKHTKGTKDDYTLTRKIDQSIRYLKVPAVKDKEDVLNILLDKISQEQSPVYTISQPKTRTLYYTLGSVAAAGLVLVMLYFTLAFETFTGVENQANVFYLPDYSRVVLADNAQLKYSKLFYNRNVKVKGEAYFEVESGDGFYVKTREGGVLVLGTRFSVNDISKRFTVNCYEGMVGVDYVSNKVKISQGMQLIGFNSEYKVIDNNNTGYPEYAFFTYSCENTGLHNIWPEIERFFGVEIIDNVSGNKSFTGSIHTGNVHEVIDIIATSMKLDFELTDSKKIIIKSREL
jgi:hypothetical protein